ncbi:phylloplanin [Dendrobium catenatum]|uniref:phylloplanin n=1 Tax=Dendrobium catenatum TaxID=906689 RepID=UPI0009F5E0F7|nr:phylloplanin [Dendrobium catenatum]
MASNKYLLLAAILISVMASQTATAQLLGLGQVHINGTVHCSVSIPTAITPVFPNALMALQCGSSVISTTTTNTNGVFDFSLNLLSSLFSTLLNDCKLIVNTPLSTCDSSLPSIGFLQSPLQLLSPASGLLGGILSGFLQLIPSGFSLIN